MKKRILNLIILLILLLIPSGIFADEIKSIIIIVDEISLNDVEELSIGRPSIGWLNLKTKAAYSEENLFRSISLGRKLGNRDFNKEDQLQYLGDILKKEKLSHIGVGKEAIILSDSQGKLDYQEKSMEYDLEWLVRKTDLALNKSNLLVIGYNFQDQWSRKDVFKKYLERYKDEQIIVVPKTVSTEDQVVLNKSLVPIIHINNEGSGLLTSLSTKRIGFITIEDISVQIKNTYGYSRKSDMGNKFQTITREEPIKEVRGIYNRTMNLLRLAYIFHGITYMAQGVLGLWVLRPRGNYRNIYSVYLFPAISLCLSLILGIFKVHNNIFIYVVLIMGISYVLSRNVFTIRNKFLENLVFTTYGLIVFGTLFYPEIIYDSYIGFNNLVYGARYYGLNNGIMGVLLASSILSYISLSKKTGNINIRRTIGVCIFGLNILVLSTRFGANTGGFITSTILFVLMMSILFFEKSHFWKKITIFSLIVIILFAINILMDNNSENQSHAIQFFYRLKENGLKEFISMASFKAMELLKLTLIPPFSLVLICQGIILKKLSKVMLRGSENEKIGKVILITALIGFIINDTGVIMLIYMVNYLILYMLTCGEEF